MLVIHRFFERVRRASASDDGAVLVAVIGVMIVGFIVAALVASTVVFTIGENDRNRDNLDAFIAAESGRDAAVAAVVGGCNATTVTGTAPDFTATVYSVALTSGGGEPTSSDGLTASCPTEDTDFVIINSVGTGPDGRTAEVDAVFPWQVTFEEQPGGTLAYFDGTFTTTKSNYVGDLVVRDTSSLYWCNNSGTIEGDLYVLFGNARFSGGCRVEGDVYVAGTVEFDSSGTTVTGDIIAGGNVSLASDGNTVEGNIHSGGNVDLTGTGSGVNGAVGTTGDPDTGDVLAAGTVTIDPKWAITGTSQPGVAAPVFNPTMDQIYDMTTWIDMTTQNWNTQATFSNTCGNNFNPTPLLDDASTSLLVDYTGCSGNAIDITITSGAVTRDVIFLVAPNKRMNVSIDGNLTSTGSPKHQMLFVHADASLAVNAAGERVPHCGNGNQNDKFDIPSGTIEPRVMIYTPCGLTGNISVDFSGQFYTANDGNHTISSTFTCTPMTWPPVFNELSCRIKGEGGAGGGYTTVQSLGELRYQTER
jgi:hypothetical protein